MRWTRQNKSVRCKERTLNNPQANESQRRLEELGNELQLAFSSTFDSPNGEKVMEQLARICDIKSQRLGTPPKGSIDPYELAWREGMRSVYWYIETNLEAGRELIRG